MSSELSTVVQKIVAENLHKMRGQEGGEMMALIVNESIGGNAGHLGLYPCIAANFFFDEKTGKIVYFGNIQHVPEHIRQQYPEGTFRLAIDWMKSGKLCVINRYMRGDCSPKAQQSLEETVRQYNEWYGFVSKE